MNTSMLRHSPQAAADGPSHDAIASADIDWQLLLLLARKEASMTWPDMPQASDLSQDAEPVWSLPAGLDLRHSGDLDWVSRVAAAQ